MTDRDLFHRTVGEFPSLFLPIFGALFLAWLVENLLPRVLLKVFSAGLFPILERLANPYRALKLLGLLNIPLFMMGAILSTLLSLGAFRLCLDRGEGRPGRPPWIILPQWRRYRGWLLWMGLIPLLWRAGKGIGRVWLANRLDDMAYARFNMGMSYWNVALTVGSLVLFSLLALSVRTAYLRFPEKGFWPSVGFGLREGFRKWPKTIGAQLKFVVPIHVGQGIAAILLRRLALRVGGPGISALCGGAGQVLSWMSTIWILTLYGHLAADRYEPPEEGM